MISFESDYNNGMLPEILKLLARQTVIKHLVMVLIHTQNLQKKIRKAVDNENAEVFFPDRRYADQHHGH